MKNRCQRKDSGSSIDPIICCALGICCPPETADQLEAFTLLMEQHMGDPVKADHVAKAMHKELIAFSKALRKAVEVAKDE